MTSTALWLALLSPSITVILTALGLAQRIGKTDQKLESVDNKVNGVTAEVEKVSSEVRTIGRDVSTLLERSAHHGQTLERHEERLGRVESSGAPTRRG